MNDTVIYWLRFSLDFLIVAYIIYRILLFTRNKKAGNILKGMSLVAAVWVISGLAGLEALRVIFGQVLIYGIFGLIVIFQPELRNALENLGKRNFSLKTNSLSDRNKLNSKTIDGIIKALFYMSERKIGALICFEESDSLDTYAKTGIQIDSVISEQLLENIFAPNVPLHDGALIIRNQRIDSASCYLSLSSTESLNKHLGTRHRASLGLSEVSDATILIVSEETGAISFARKGQLYYDMNQDSIRDELNRLLKVDNTSSSSDTLSLKEIYKAVILFLKGNTSDSQTDTIMKGDKDDETTDKKS